MTEIAERLAELRRTGLHRRLRLIEGPQGPRVLLDGADVLLLCSNNYLGLADHPSVRAAAAEAAERYGAGAGSSRLISGSMSAAPHARGPAGALQGHGGRAAVRLGLPRQHGHRLGARAAAARSSSPTSSTTPSIIDGCRLSRAETFVYRHADTEHLEWGLRDGGGAGAADRHRQRLLDGRRRRPAHRARSSWPSATAACSWSTRRTAPARSARAAAARSPPPGSSARST